MRVSSNSLSLNKREVARDLRVGAALHLDAEVARLIVVAVGGVAASSAHDPMFPEASIRILDAFSMINTCSCVSVSAVSALVAEGGSARGRMSPQDILADSSLGIPA